MCAFPHSAVGPSCSQGHWWCSVIYVCALLLLWFSSKSVTLVCRCSYAGDASYVMTVTEWSAHQFQRHEHLKKHVLEFMKYGREHPKDPHVSLLTTQTALRLSLSHVFMGEYMLWASTAWKNKWFLNYCGSESLTDGWLDFGSPILKPPELFLEEGVQWVLRGKLHSPVWSAFSALLVLININCPWWSHNVHTIMTVNLQGVRVVGVFLQR